MTSNNDLNVEELPKPIRLAALDVATQYASLGIFDAKEAQSKRQEFNLWLVPSWRQANSLGCSEACFAELVRADSWNISSYPHLLKDLQTAMMLVGNEAWKIFSCKISIEQAREDIQRVGPEDFIAGLEALIALKKMSN